MQLLGFHRCRCGTMTVQTVALQSGLQLCAVLWSRSIAGCRASTNGLNLQLIVRSKIAVQPGNLLSYYLLGGGCNGVKFQNKWSPYHMLQVLKHEIKTYHICHYNNKYLVIKVKTECWFAEGDTTVEIRFRVKGQPWAAAAGQPGKPRFLEPRRQ